MHEDAESSEAHPWARLWVSACQAPGSPYPSTGRGRDFVVQSARISPRRRGFLTVAIRAQGPGWRRVQKCRWSKWPHFRPQWHGPSILPTDGHGRHWAAQTLEADELCGYSNLLDGQRPHPSQHVRNLTGNVSIAVGGYPEVERDLPRVETSLWVNLHRQPGGSALHAAQHDDAGQQQNRSHCGLKRHDQIHVPRTVAKPRQP